MSDRKRVLVFPCGSEIGLEIERSLRYSKDFELVGASSLPDHGRLAYARYIEGVPFVDDPAFVDHLRDVVETHDIDLVFPAHDSVVLELARHAADLGATLATSPVETCEIARSKSKTYAALAGVVRTPAVYDAGRHEFPVFLKPDVGQGSKGTALVHDEDALRVALAERADRIILEYVPGVEYTVDCFTDSDGELRFAQGRERMRTVNGISVQSKPSPDPEFRRIAERINEALTFRGVWFFQVKRDTGGELVLLEVAPRVAGTMALCRMQGVNLPLLAAYEFTGTRTAILQNRFGVEIDRALSTRFVLDLDYDTVYLDFDDALVVDGAPNPLLLALLYQFRNEGKVVVLLTKHAGDIHQTLASHAISERLFDEIVCISHDAEKIEHMKREQAIFIDDSFSERRRVFEALGIPVFDVSEAVELLAVR
ncbi:MAG TPA: ATP-grasp domain-containing protein [Acidimicrobiia bacterium]|nr:ATP-grasp domain-containing protein [Acidimicrobiia bacterium]